MGPGPLIAIDVVLLYTIFGPLILLAVYVLFDFLEGGDQGNLQQSETGKTNPALWTEQQIDMSEFDGSVERI
jgi:hypothetical protein